MPASSIWLQRDSSSGLSRTSRGRPTTSPARTSEPTESRPEPPCSKSMMAKSAPALPSTSTIVGSPIWIKVPNTLSPARMRSLRFFMAAVPRPAPTPQPWSAPGRGRQQ